MTERASEGTPFFQSPLNSARVQNNLLEAAERYHSQEARGRGGADLQLPASGNLVKVKNSTGDVVRSGEVLEFSDFLLSDDLNPESLWFVGSTPDQTSIGWGVLRRQTIDGKIADAHVAGTCVAWVNVTDSGHGYAKVLSGEKVLQSAASGPARILYKPSGTGELKCAVLLGSPSQLGGFTAYGTGASNVVNGNAVLSLVKDYEGGSAPTSSIATLASNVLTLNESGVWQLTYGCSLSFNSNDWNLLGGTDTNVENFAGYTFLAAYSGGSLTGELGRRAIWAFDTLAAGGAAGNPGANVCLSLIYSVTAGQGFAVRNILTQGNGVKTPRITNGFINGVRIA